MIARIRLQPEAVGLGMTGQRVRDRLIERLRENGIRDERVLAAIRAVPRHLFVDEAFATRAYEDTALPIGHGQTISQPWVVARMTEAVLAALPAHGAQAPAPKVLEIGTGSGYQAAVLAELVGEVYSIEIVEPLARQAAQRLQRLGYANVHTTVGDGYYGWKAHAPYDAIVVTAAAPSVPPPLLEQLKPGGRMVIPVGTSFFAQTLMLVEKRADGKVRTTQLLPVRFVPLTRGEAR